MDGSLVVLMDYISCADICQLVHQLAYGGGMIRCWRCLYSFL